MTTDSDGVEGCAVIDGVHLKPPIPDAEYVVEFGHYFSAKVFKERTPKICLVFYVVEGEHTGYQLERWYTVRKINALGKNGEFVATSATCVLLMEFCACFPDQTITRLDRVPMSRWKRGRFRVSTNTPKKNHNKRITPETLRSSVIREILGRA